MRISKLHKNLFSDMNEKIHRMATEKQANYSNQQSASLHGSEPMKTLIDLNENSLQIKPLKRSHFYWR